MRTLAVVCVVLVACKPHVTLVPPPPRAPPEERVRAFNELHAVSEKRTWTTTCGGGGGCNTTVEHELNLANGATVHHVEDLLPVLPPDSEAAREVRAAKRKQARQPWFAVGLLGALAAGVIIITQTDNGDAALLVTAAIALPTAGFAWWNYYSTNRHIERAHDAYNDGLAQRLNVCVEGYAVVACESAAAPPPSLSPPPPSPSPPSLSPPPPSP